MVIGIGWGTSLSEMVNNLPFLPMAGVQVVQVIGSVGGKSNPHVDGPGLASNLASKLNADYKILHSPLFLDSENTCKTLKAQKQINETLEAGYTSTVVLLGVGTVEVDPVFSSIYRSGFLSENEIMDVRRKGGVGNFCGAILDINGKVIDIEINRRSMAVDLYRLRNTGCKMVGIAAGERKSKAIESVLNGEWLNVLVTDTTAVRPIFED
jgi:deoxyribonucleoside regulator